MQKEHFMGAIVCSNPSAQLSKWAGWFHILLLLYYPQALLVASSYLANYPQAVRTAYESSSSYKYDLPLRVRQLITRVHPTIEFAIRRPYLVTYFSQVARSTYSSHLQDNHQCR